MRGKAAWWVAALVAAMLGPKTEVRAQDVVSHVIQGATNVVIINNGAAGWGYAPAPATDFEATTAPPDRPSRGRSLWGHNDSIVALEAQGNRRRFSYHRPRSGLVAAGARPGSLLFEGARDGDSYAGTARVFAGSCGVYRYDVRGPVIAERRVVVHGMAPRISPVDCRILGYRHDTLVFTLL